MTLPGNYTLALSIYGLIVSVSHLLLDLFKSYYIYKPFKKFVKYHLLFEKIGCILYKNDSA